MAIELLAKVEAYKVAAEGEREVHVYQSVFHHIAELICSTTTHRHQSQHNSHIVTVKQCFSVCWLVGWWTHISVNFACIELALCKQSSMPIKMIDRFRISQNLSR